MKKLVIIQTVAPDYRSNFFNTLKETLKNRFELYAGDVSFEKTIKTNYKNILPVKNYFLFNRKIIFQTGIWHLLLKKDVLVLELNPRNISNWIFLIIRKIFKKPTVLWGHAWSRNGKNSNSDVLRNFMRNISVKIIVYTKQQQKELQHRMPKKEILAAPNAVYRTEEMQTVVKKNQYNLIYVGRLVAFKKVFFMVESFHFAIPNLPKETKLLIVGDGDEKIKMERYIQQHSLHNRIILFGHISDYNKLKELYDSSIFSLSPGYVGLSVTQSFGFGVPMLVSKNENHSPEIEAVKENENALFFKTNSKKDFSDKLCNIYGNFGFWQKQRTKIVNFCKKEYSTEAMAQVFINLIN